MNRQLFSGCGTALATPFRGGEVDYGALGALIERQLSGGVDALILCGTTGEPSTLTPEEKKNIWSLGVEQVRGRVPVFAGTGGNDTREVIEQSVAAHGGNQTAAARALGISRTTLWRVLGKEK